MGNELWRTQALLSGCPCNESNFRLGGLHPNPEQEPPPEIGLRSRLDSWLGADFGGGDWCGI
jgi:hypothetical protein